ncbi:MAG: prohibitin family protein [Gammaproteobacteria bacterium]
MRIARYIVIAVVAFIAFVILNPVVIVGPGERGVVVTFGKVADDVLGEGIHIRIPIAQQVVIMNVQIQKEETETAASSKDLQDTHSSIALNFHIEPERANWVYQNLRNEYNARVIDPAVQEVVKAVTARYTAVELITQREVVKDQIKAILRTRLKDYGIGVDDFAITNFRFSEQFTQAIEAKQSAEQLALKAQRDLDRIKIEAEQKVAQAQAEAEALRLQKENITSELVQLRSIEAQMKAIEKWDGRLPGVTGAAVPFINVSGTAPPG